MKPHAYAILGNRHGSTVIEQVGDLITAADSREAFMPFRTVGSHPEFATVWLCRLEVERTVRLDEPVEKPAAVTTPEQSAAVETETPSPTPAPSAKQRRK